MYGLNYFSIFLISNIFTSDYINKNYDCKNSNVNQSKSLIFEGTTTNLESQHVNSDIKSDSICNSFNFLIDYLRSESNNFENYEEYNNIEHKNKSLEINNTLNLKKNKRKIENNEQIDINTKYICLERNLYIYNASTFDSHYHETCLNYNISNFESNISRLVCLNLFNYIFEIVINDLINILKIAVNFSILKNEFILPIILNLENTQFNEQKIIYFMNIANEILKKEINYRIYNKDKHNFIDENLSTSYLTNNTKKIFNNKLCKKTVKIYNYLREHKITHNDILNITIDYIIKTTDKRIQYFFIFGFQSLFNNFSNNFKSHLIRVLIILQTLNKEKEYYDIKWHEKLFKFLSLSYYYIKSSNNYCNIINKNYDNNLIEAVSIYLAMNSKELKFEYQIEKKLQYDFMFLNFVIHFIDLTSKIKCKLFEINF